MSLNLSPIFNDAQFDDNGNLLNQGLLYWDAAGSTTPQATYTDNTGATPQAYPIVLNARGEPSNPIWLTSGLTYKARLFSAAGVLIRTIDNIQGVNDLGSISVDEWVASGLTPTYLTATTFSVPGNQTSDLQIGRRIKVSVTAGTKYGRILNSVFTTLTTVTVLLDSGSLDSGLSSVSYGLLSATNSSIPINLIPQSIKNPVVNGGMRIAQNGASFAAAVSLAYDLDGWTNENTSAAVFTIARTSALLGTGNPSVMRRDVTVTTADAAVAAGDYVAQRNAIEGYDCVALIGRTFTIGFWVRSSVIGIHCLSIYDGTKSYVAEYTINVADTAEYKTITIIGGLQTAASFTNAAGIYLFFSNMNGATYQTTKEAWNAGFFVGTSSQVNDMATIGNLFSLSDVTIQLGYAALPNRLSYEEDLRKCKRYFQIVTNYFSGDVTNALNYSAFTMLPIEMRTTPTASGANLVATRFPAASGSFALDSTFVREARTSSSTGTVGAFSSTVTLSARL